MKRNRMLKKISAAALSALMLFTAGATGLGTVMGTSTTASALALDEYHENGFTYSINEYGAFIKSYSGTEANVIIPDSLGGTPVFSLGYRSFALNNTITSVTVPETVSQILESAFLGCKNLKSVRLPDNLSLLYGNVFSGCSKLESIELPKNLEYVGSDIFDGCTSLKSMVIPDGFENVPYGFFSSCTGLETVAIPSSVKAIDTNAFRLCRSLKETELPNNLEQIGVRAFGDCESLTGVTLPGSVTSINCYAFENCTSLKYIIIPDSVTVIESDAFAGCTSLTIFGGKNSEAQKYASENNIPFEEYSPLKNISAISETDIIKGASVTVSCASEGGVGNTEYAVFYKQKSQTSWTCAQKYKSNATVSITPKAATAYTIRVKAKDASGKVSNKDLKLNVCNPIKNTSAISDTLIVKGDSVDVSCSSTGGIGTIQYAVFMKQEGQTSWSCAQKYSTNKSVTLTPKSATAYNVRVKAKDKNGNISNRDFRLEVTKPISNTSSLTSEEIKKGSSAVVNCSSTGGAGTPEYAVYYRQKTQTSWTLAQSYSTNTVVKITPKAATTYVVRVKARDSRKNVSNKDIELLVTK